MICFQSEKSSTRSMLRMGPMNESEVVTRKKRIDLKLKSPLLNWAVIHNDEAADT